MHLHMNLAKLCLMLGDTEIHFKLLRLNYILHNCIFIGFLPIWDIYAFIIFYRVHY